MIKLLAPAKINLTLEVLAERSDGFHEILSVIQTINLCDSFSFQTGKEIVIRCDNKAWHAEQSLVTRVVALLKRETGYSGGALIEISKKIPLSSGLGGDSSDAAAVLKGLNQLWDLNISQRGLVERASRLGSDIPFFLFGGTALLRGRGEIVSPLPPMEKVWLVLLVPPMKRLKDKTAQQYKNLNADNYTDGRLTEELVVLLTRNEQISRDNLYNVFENFACDSFKGLDEYYQKFLQAGSRSIHLAGSGPILLTVVKKRAQAHKIYTALKMQGLEAYLVETLEGIKPLNNAS